MVGHFIASTRKGDFRSLVFQGIQVTSCHAQLSSLLREQLGDAYARLLAEPLKDAQKDIIDWYAPVFSPGADTDAQAIPLADLSPEAQQEIRTRLQDMRAHIEQLAQKLMADSDSSRHLSGTLLQMATRFPDESHIYVSGQDIILTCWGMNTSSFEENTENVVRTGLLAAPIAAPVAVPAAAPVATPVAAPVTATAVAGTALATRCWWKILLWILLGLLLLLLLLGGLRSCTNNGSLPFGLSGCTRQASVPPVLPQDNATEEKSAPLTLPVPPDLDLAALPDLRAEVEALKQKAQEKALLCPENTVPKEASPEIPALPAEPVAPADLGDLLAEMSPPEPEKIPEAPQKTEPKKPEPLPKKKPAPQEPPKSGDAMKLPPKNEKSMEFLKGCWNCETGLSDMQNNPIKVEFCFNDSGQGNVTVIDKQNRTYRGAARAKLQDGKLSIDADRAVLPKGRAAFNGVLVDCTPDQQGNAMCYGTNKDHPNRWNARFTRK